MPTINSNSVKRDCQEDSVKLRNEYPYHSLSEERNSFACRLIILLLFIVPMTYIASILAVAIHEILGHGLTALCVGGEFKGFLLKWDGMGYAFAYPPVNAEKIHSIIIFSDGVIATSLTGIAFLVLAFVKKNHFFTHMVLLLFASSCLLEGPPYIFWNAYNSAPPGDIFYVLALSGFSLLRWLLMFLGGTLTIVGIVVINIIIFRAIEQWSGNGRKLQGWQRIIALFLLFAGQALAWFSFDWNQIAQGLGHLPNIMGCATTFIMVVILYFWSLHVPVCKKKVKEAFLPTVVAWLLVSFLCLAIWLWFSQGVTWA